VFASDKGAVLIEIFSEKGSEGNGKLQGSSEKNTGRRTEGVVEKRLTGLDHVGRSEKWGLGFLQSLQGIP